MPGKQRRSANVSLGFTGIPDYDRRACGGTNRAGGSPSVLGSRVDEAAVPRRRRGESVVAGRSTERLPFRREESFGSSPGRVSANQRNV